MKKWLMFLLIFTVIIMASLYQIQNMNLETSDSWEKIITKIENEEDVDLNTFIDKYNKWDFEKVDLKDNIKLQWYEYLWEGPDTTSMLLRETIKQKNYKRFNTNKPADTSLTELGFSLTWAIPINVDITEKSVLGTLFLEQLLPLLFFVWIIILLFKFLGPKWGGFPFGAQAWKLANKAEVKTTFNDVAGMEEVKEELKEIVDYLKDPKKYIKAWARIPKWLLLYWPPWSWKTLVARAVAWEASVPFFSASGSEFMEMLVWMWAAKVRELFKKAKATSPSIIFIDEIDTIGKKRWAWYTGWHQEQEQTLNQILTEMDWFDRDTKVIVIAATNRPDILDPALLRPGRFDRKTYVWRPTLEERLQIIKIHCANKKLEKDVDLSLIARRTSGFVWADLANIANEAALRAARYNRYILKNEDFEYALEKIIMGPEKKIKSIKEKERQTIAFHELGHAVSAYTLPNADPVEKISIVSRWMALWVTWIMPQEDRYLNSKAKFLDEIVTLLGGRAAEQIFFGKDEITTWASNDFEKASKIATDMIMKYWMDEELWPVMYYDEEKASWMPFKPFSEKTAEIIDKKIKNLIKGSYTKALKIIEKNKAKIKKLALILLEKEFLTKEEFEESMKDSKKMDKILKQAQITKANLTKIDTKKSKK